MNCVEFESAMEFAVEERQRPAERVLEHAAACTQCRQLLSLQSQLDLVIEAWCSVDPSEGFVDRVLAEVSKPAWDDDADGFELPFRGDVSRMEVAAAESALPQAGSLQTGSFQTVALARAAEGIEKSVRRSHRTALASIGACLFVVAVTTSLISTLPSGAFNRHLTLNRMQPLTHDELASLDVSDTIAEVFSDLRSGYQEMASETSVAAREIVGAIPDISAPPLPPTEDLDLLPDSSDVKRLWRPIGSRVSTALGFLWQTVPSEIPAG